MAVDSATAAVNEAQAAVDASAVYHETVTVTGQANVVLNGTFDSASNWTNIGMGSDATMTNSSIARVYNGVLIGSYVYSTYIQQTGTFQTPTRSVTFSYDMSNNNDNWGNRPQADQYRVEFRTYSANGTRLNYYNTGDRANIFPWTHFSATYTLPEDAVRWDIGFRMSDTGYWNGNFAGSIDNVQLIADTSSITPAYTSYDSNLVNILAQKKAELVAAKSILDSFPAKTISAPTGLTGSVDGSTVTLNWNSPSSGLIPERYAIMWTDGTGGWGIASTTTSATIDASVIGSTAGWDKDYTFKVRSDHDTASMYSGWSNEVTVHLSAPVVPVTSPSPSESPTATSSPAPETSTAPSPTPSPSASESSSPTPEPTQSTVPQVPSTTPSTGSIMGTISEGGVLQLIAPITKVFTSILFASYGTPNDYQIDPNCHAESSMQKVMEFVLGRQLAEIIADNGVFGDPCGGVVKRLSVIAQYGDATPVPSTSDSATVVSPTPEPSPSVEPTPTPTPTPEPVVTQSPAPQPAPQPEPAPVPVPQPVPQPSPTPTPEVSPSPTPEPSPSQSPEPTPEPTPEPSASATPEPSPTPSPEETPTPQPSQTPTPEPSSSASPEPTPTPTDIASEPPVVEEKPTTAEEKAAVGLALVAALAPGEALSAAEIKEAGISYADLPPATPVEVRTDAEGNPVVITAEVADALTLVENPAELVGALFSDPAKALLALGSLGADMSPQERESAQKGVVAAVVVGQLATGAASGVATQRRGK